MPQIKKQLGKQIHFNVKMIGKKFKVTSNGGSGHGLEVGTAIVLVQYAGPTSCVFSVPSQSGITRTLYNTEVMLCAITAEDLENDICEAETELAFLKGKLEIVKSLTSQKSIEPEDLDLLVALKLLDKSTDTPDEDRVKLLKTLMY